MKNKIILFLTALAMSPTVAWAAPAWATPFSDFKSRVRQELIKPCALDIGGILGAASFHSGGNLGFPGFRVDGVVASQSTPDKSNRILRDAGVNSFNFPMLEASVGLPLKIDAMLHGFGINDVTVFGGGLRYNLLAPPIATPFIPHIGVSVSGDKVNYSAFTATHLGADATVTWKLPFVEPSLGMGADFTRLKVEAASPAALAITPNLVGMSATAAGSRFWVGLDLKPFPFVRMHGAYIIIHGVTGGNFGLAVTF